MKIFPRVIDINSESDEHCFFISNQANTSDTGSRDSHTHVLLFRIRRPELKRLSFHPKKGVIEAGSTCQITIRMVDIDADKPNNTRINGALISKDAPGQVSKLLVKAVLVNKATLLDDRRKGIKFDFEKYWLHGLEESGGKEVRKIVDIIATSLANGKQSPQHWIEEEEHDFSNFVAQSLRSRLLQQSSEIFSESASIRMSSITSKVVEDGVIQQIRNDGYVMNEDSVPEPTLTDTGRDASREESLLEKHGASSLRSISYYQDNLRNNSDFIGAISGAQSSTDYLARAYEEEALGVSISNESSNSSEVDKLKHESIVAADDCSRLVLLGGKSSNTFSGSVLVEVFGPTVTDATLSPLMTKRLQECKRQHARVVSAVELTECSISSLDPLLLRGEDFSWKDSVRHLIVNNCSKLNAISLSINGLHNLLSLNLCGNDISGLCYPNVSNRDGGIRSLPLLDLPNLRTLDLSHNRLQSLDFLQLLLQLRTLLVSHNNITSLLLSVNTLVPLALHLTTLDLSSNPVCKDIRYAEEVLSVLPGLHYFDSIDMNTFGKTYRASKGSVISSFGAHEQRIGNSDRSDSFLKSTASSRSRFEAPAVRSRRYVSTAPESTLKEKFHPLPEFPCVVSSAPQSVLGDDRLFRNPAFELKLTRSSVTSSPSRVASNSNNRGPLSGGKSHHGRRTNSTLEAPTQSALIRWQAFGIVPAQHRSAVGERNDDCSDDQSTAASVNLHRRHETCRKPPFFVGAKISRQVFLEMQEGERHGIWQSRYQVPKPNFGFSKPFIERQQPTPTKNVPLFEKTVQRLQDAFQKLPCRGDLVVSVQKRFTALNRIISSSGTFTRSSKGLPAEFYPMDYTEVECYRRQGYFSQVIGSKAEDSLTEPRSVRPRSASAPARRTSLSPHKSRQYREVTELSSPLRRKSVDDTSRSMSPTTPNRMQRRGSGASSPTLSTKSGINSLNNKEFFPDMAEYKRGSALSSRTGEDTTLFGDLPYFEALKGYQEGLSQSIFDMNSTASSIRPVHSGGGLSSSAPTNTNSHSNGRDRVMAPPVHIASAWDAQRILSAQAATTEGKHRFRYELSPVPSPPEKKRTEQERQADNIRASTSASFVAPDDFYPAHSEYHHDLIDGLSAASAQTASARVEDAQYYLKPLFNDSGQSAFGSTVAQHSSTPHHDQAETLRVTGNVDRTAVARNSDEDEEVVAMQDYLAWLDSQHGSNVSDNFA